VTQPQSVGSVHIKSTDPFQPPSVHPNFYSDVNQADYTAAATCLGTARAIASYVPEYLTELVPGLQLTLTPESTLFYIIGQTVDAHNSFSSCRMGLDPSTSVVTPALTVWNFANLRIVDSSVVPLPARHNSAFLNFLLGFVGGQLAASANYVINYDYDEGFNTISYPHGYVLVQGSFTGDTNICTQINAKKIKLPSLTDCSNCLCNDIINNLNLSGDVWLGETAGACTAFDLANGPVVGNSLPFLLPTFSLTE